MAFALSTLVLAGTTFYLANELSRIRTRSARNPVAAQPIAAEATTIAQTPAAPVADAYAIAPPDTSTQDVRTQPATSQAEAARTTRLRTRLDELNDPVARARQVAELRAAMAASSKELQLAHLQPHEVERLLDHMAESMVRDRQRVAECNLTPGCDPRAGREQRMRDEVREMEQAVGVDVVARMNHHDAKLRIREFNDALPATAKLPDATVDALAAALAEERRRSIDEDDPAPSRRRAQDRAAALLTPEQMEIFRTRQARLLAWD